MDQIQQVIQYLTVPRNIVILSHRNPDGDAIGSSLALSFALNKMRHKVEIVLPSECPPIFNYLEDIHKISIFDLDQNGCRAKIEQADTIFCLDFNGLDRIDKLGEKVSFSKAKKIMIDHHLDPEPFADFEFCDVEASSTSELVYKFLVDIGQKHLIDIKTGEALFTGLITDTGSFKYNTRAYTYEVAGALKQIGVDDYSLQNAIFNVLKEKNLRLLGHCLANRMEVIPQYNTALIYLTKQDYIDFDIQRGDTEGIVNYMLMLETVNLAAFITEQPSIIKISLRSKGDLDVQSICNKHFNGGGHKNASGGSAYAKLDDIVTKFKNLLPSVIPFTIDQDYLQNSK